MASPSAPSTRPRFGYIPGLDGIRGFWVVVGPLMYHARPDVIPGGILGIDLFFVLSSYLITSIALNEWEKRGHIDLVAYAGRRVRRLLPALFLLLLFLGIYLMFNRESEDVSRWTGAMVSTLTYSANWYEIASGVSYFDAFTFSPLRHVWSFSIEEQFYVFAPLFLIGVLVFARRRSLSTNGAYRVILALTVAGALLSAWWMSYLYTGGEPSRVYYGTDTRAQTLLVGMALAAMVRLWGPVRTVAGRRVLVYCAYGATAAYFWGIFQLSETTAWMFDRGGFLLAAVLAGFMVYGVAQPALVMPRVLQQSDSWPRRVTQGAGAAAAVLVVWMVVNALMGTDTKDHLIYLLPSMVVAFIYGADNPTVDPLHWFLEARATRWVGKISYGLYLYHWPIYLLVTPARAAAMLPGVGVADLTANRLVVFHIVLTFIVSTASYYLVELPFVQRRFPIIDRPLTLPNGTFAGSTAVVGILAALLFVNANQDSADAAQSSPCAQQTIIPPAGVGEELRVLVVGDSVALQLGESLCQYAIDNPGLMVVLNEAHVGCVVGRYGEKIAPNEPPGEVGDLCSAWADPVSVSEMLDPEVVSWPTAVEVFQPDVVLATITPWDVTDRQVPSLGPDFTFVGQPDFDEYIGSEYRLASEVLGSTGAEVLWLDGPHLNKPIVPQNDPVRIDRLNRIVHDATSDLPYVGFIDYPSFVGEVGSEQELSLRDDGVHLSEKGREEVQAWLYDRIAPTR